MIHPLPHMGGLKVAQAAFFMCEMGGEMDKQEIFTQLLQQDFVKKLIEDYKELCFFSVENIVIEHQDVFGQCVVYLNFEDQFAIRDAFGVWKQSTAEESTSLANGTLPKSFSLVN